MCRQKTLCLGLSRDSGVCGEMSGLTDPPFLSSTCAKRLLAVSIFSDAKRGPVEGV